jgi:hypothetical protein
LQAGYYELLFIADYDVAKQVCAREEFIDRAQMAFFENTSFLISTNGG